MFGVLCSLVVECSLLVAVCSSFVVRASVVCRLPTYRLWLVCVFVRRFVFGDVVCYLAIIAFCVLLFVDWVSVLFSSLFMFGYCMVWVVHCLLSMFCFILLYV